mgnify:CR=1 FL=1
MGQINALWLGQNMDNRRTSLGVETQTETTDVVMIPDVDLGLGLVVFMISTHEHFLRTWKRANFLLAVYPFWHPKILDFYIKQMLSAHLS